MLNHNLVELEWQCAYHRPYQHSFEPPFVIGWCSELLASKITVNHLTNLSHNVITSPYGKRFMWLIKEKDEPTGSHGVCQGRKFFGCDVFNQCSLLSTRAWFTCRESRASIDNSRWAWGTWNGLRNNSSWLSGAELQGGQCCWRHLLPAVETLSARHHFAGTASVGVSAAWHLNVWLEGVLLRLISQNCYLKIEM